MPLPLITRKDCSHARAINWIASMAFLVEQRLTYLNCGTSLTTSSVYTRECLAIEVGQSLGADASKFWVTL